MLPKLLGIPRLARRSVTVESGDATYVLESVNGSDPRKVMSVLRAMDGTRTPRDIARRTGIEERAVRDLTRALDGAGLVSDRTPSKVRPALDVLFELEDLANELLYQSIYRNPFWQAMLTAPNDAPVNVFYGMAIENYHFLFRESYFDAPALNFPASTKARGLMNAFYREEYGHDELILKGLTAIGVTRADLADTVPLPQTMGLCNALAFWARYEPVFFFSTLGVLEGKDVRIDSYVDACERRGLPEQFVGPIRAHAQINMEGEHGSLTRAMFEHLPAINAGTVAHLRAQTRLFISIYDDFYSGVWQYYSQDNPLLRRLSTYRESA